MDPTIPLLTGLLAGTVLKNDLLKVQAVEVVPPDAFVVRFASGLALRVRVEQES